jgi:UDP-N-acetylglucosamine:LPS N-acetylglucosamine transferase
LRELPQQVPRLVVEFTSDIPRYMQLADFLIGKPGPGSVSEAVRMGLPVLVVDNAWTMPQERYNADWIRENHLGIVLRSFRSIERGVSQLLGQLDEFCASVRRIDNRALFEIPDMLANILQEADRMAPDGARLRSPSLPAHPETR